MSLWRWKGGVQGAASTPTQDFLHAPSSKINKEKQTLRTVQNYHTHSQAHSRKL